MAPIFSFLIPSGPKYWVLNRWHLKFATLFHLSSTKLPIVRHGRSPDGVALSKVYCNITVTPGSPEECVPNFSARGSLLATKINHASSHPCWRKPSIGIIGINTKKKYISELILQSYECIPVAYVKTPLHDLTLIKLSVAPFVVTGCFLIGYSKGHMK